MANFEQLTCNDEARREALIAHPSLNGIDYIEVVTEPGPDNQRELQVYFIDKPSLTTMLDELDGNAGKVVIKGGARIRNIKVLEVVREVDHLKVRVDQPGDFSTYTLTIIHPSLDLKYQQCDFNFKVGCPSRFDCQTEVVCPPEPRAEIPIDYMAKDYASFRRALLDLIPTLAPTWKERLEADRGISLLELLAYAGDYLSYYQDAVANELCLQTARQRISVRRHARLIDYRMHDGASARTVVFFQVDAPLPLPAETQVFSGIDAALGAHQPPHPPVLAADLRSLALSTADAVFETMGNVELHQDLNEIAIYAWGNRQCCLPRGTTELDVEGDLTSLVKPGSLLLVEEVKGPETGLAADADPAHRQLLRVTVVSARTDLLNSRQLTHLEWSDADALTFPLCLSAKLEDGTEVDGVSVVRGNLVLADHGRTFEDELHAGPRTPPHKIQRLAHRIQLREAPLSFRVPLAGDNGQRTPAATYLNIDPREAVPQVTKLAVRGTSPVDDWEPVVPDLLSSTRFDHHFVVETDNRGRAQVRFGDDIYGMAPPDDADDVKDIVVTYRVGVGSAGNIGRDSLAHVVEPNGSDWSMILSLRNPLPAWGGVDPESIEQVKQVAPAAFHAEQFRAVTEDDYARTAEKHADIGHAVATFRWTGSWHTVFINIDPVGRSDVSDELRQDVHDFVLGFTQAGYDLEIQPPIYVPLEIEIDVCVDREHFRADVEVELLVALSNQQFPDGTQGLFHPDNFSFDQSMYLSRLLAAVESVPGVDSAVVRRFIRQDEDDPDLIRPATRANIDRGYITAGRLEIVRLDNDPNFLENGVLKLNMLSGK